MAACRLSFSIALRSDAWRLARSSQLKLGKPLWMGTRSYMAGRLYGLALFETAVRERDLPDIPAPSVAFGYARQADSQRYSWRRDAKGPILVDEDRLRGGAVVLQDARSGHGHADYRGRALWKGAHGPANSFPRGRALVAAGRILRWLRQASRLVLQHGPQPRKDLD